MTQLNLPFGKPRVLSGKKSERITITCSEEFKAVIDLVSRLTDATTSEIGHRYFVEGIKADIGQIFMAEPHLDKSLTEILSKI